MQHKYTNYTEEQFLEDPDFINWVKYHNKADDIFWNKLISSNPSNLKDIESAALKLSIILSDNKNYIDENLKAEVWNSISHTLDHSNGKVRPLYYKWMAAASVIIVFSLIALYMFNTSKGKTNSKSVVNNGINGVLDLAPGNNKATITLADGSKILLDSAVNGTLAMQGKVQVTKSVNGQIEYSGNNEKVIYNLLENPRGSKVINLTLGDGTKVWLNSESSLRYPVAYVGNERRVEITGEAYFEVAYNALKPFVVKNLSKNVEIVVLGTHFNVNTYEDESSLQVTLLEGKVKVSKFGTADSKVINPGEQAQVSANIKVVSKVDLENVMAWKNGYFVLDGTSLESLMRQISRWYNVDVVYEGKISERKFGGSISRDVNLSTVIQSLKINGIVSSLKGKQLIVSEEEFE